MNKEMNRRRPSATSLLAFAMLLTVLYVLSYAPVVRVCPQMVEPPVETTIFIHEGRRYRATLRVHPFRLADGSLYPAYKPVDWLIDNAAFRKPLLAWADLWGVRDEFAKGEQLRSARRAQQRTEPQSPASMPDRLSLW